MHSMAVKRSSKTQASRTDTTRRTRPGTILRTKMRRVRTGEGDEDDEGSVLGEGQGEDIEDGREGKDDDQYEQAAPDPSDVAFLLN